MDEKKEIMLTLRITSDIKKKLEEKCGQRKLSEYIRNLIEEDLASTPK